METILTSVSLGLLATTSPCVLPLYPGFLAYLSGGQEQLQNRSSRYFLGFFVLAGVLTMMLALGVIIALLSISVGRALSVVIPLADLIIILLGVLLVLNINPFKRLPQVRVPVFSHPFVNAFLYGLLYGPIALPCSGPLVVSVFALSLTAAEALSKLTIFFWFGMGFGIPLLLLSFLSGAAQRWITRQFAMRARLINVLSGVLLIGVGIYDFSANWSALQLYL
ncbi:MAG TPA: cytochrome c biogenesis CcdA family protein [Anaerolineales bacterium]|nr:cytochrome c biogenesis CcdA family protein [Anaerolineales bacterium]